MKEAKQFFEFVLERERIRNLRENGCRRPWTQDPVLNEYRFCNVFREDDRTTRYFRETVRDMMQDNPLVLMATIGWRWFNRITTCGSIKWWTMYGWDRELAERDLRPIQKSGVPLVTGAYLIKTPGGVDKLTGILDCMDVVKEQELDIRTEICHRSLEHAHERLMQIPYLGRFMAYEIVTDLRHTYLLRTAEDIMTWASAGPGCCRGASWVRDGFPGSISYGTKRGQESALNVMRELLKMSHYEWDYLREWEMREVEHCLCEYDKYRRAQEGQRLKRKYA